ncbi:MAG: hypothetical protein K9K38_01945 [Rhodoferax sp.]|nr:hypothetical protein [Rhodoferax sp.]
MRETNTHPIPAFAALSMQAAVHSVQVHLERIDEGQVSAPDTKPWNSPDR